MKTTRRRMIAVAVVVCGFAVGMAGLLNYFKYRTTANRFVTDRLVVTGRTVENVIHLALDLGLQFSEIPTLQATLQRERDTDDLIRGIDVFDNDGRLLYSTDPSRGGVRVPAVWMKAVAAARGSDWMVDEPGASAAGMALKSSFGVTLAHLALRFSRESLAGDHAQVVRELVINTLMVFVLSSLAASAALVAVMKRLERDVADAEGALDAGDPAVVGTSGAFGGVLQRFLQSTGSVEREIADLDARLGGKGGA